jgi:hypothetical protein
LTHRNVGLDDLLMHLVRAKLQFVISHRSEMLSSQRRSVLISPTLRSGHSRKGSRCSSHRRGTSEVGQVVVVVTAGVSVVAVAVAVAVAVVVAVAVAARSTRRRSSSGGSSLVFTGKLVSHMRFFERGSARIDQGQLGHVLL